MKEEVMIIVNITDIQPVYVNDIRAKTSQINCSQFMTNTGC